MSFLKKIPGFRSGTKWKMAVAIIGYLAIFGIVSDVVGGNSDTAPATTPATIVEKTPEQIAKEKADTDLKVKQAEEAKVATDKMNSDILYYSQVKAKEVFKDKFIKAEKDDKGILITFKLAENLSMKMVGDGGLIDSGKLFALYKGHVGDYTDVTCLGTFPMKDKYGTVTDDVIFAITLDKETIQKVTFENISPTTNLIPLSSSHRIRPELLTK